MDPSELFICRITRKKRVMNQGLVGLALDFLKVAKEAYINFIISFINQEISS
jgi:hypothetical protein